MTDFEFANGLYRNEREMCAAIAETWLCADGCNSREDMLGFMAEETDEQLADDCIKNWWGKWRPDDEETPPNFERETLVDAFAELRRNFDKHFPEPSDPLTDATKTA